MFFFYKTACPQTQNMANCSSQNQHIYFWPAGTGHNWILQTNKKIAVMKVYKNFTYLSIHSMLTAISSKKTK